MVHMLQYDAARSAMANDVVFDVTGGFARPVLGVFCPGADAVAQPLRNRFDPFIIGTVRRTKQIALHSVLDLRLDHWYRRLRQVRMAGGMITDVLAVLARKAHQILTSLFGIRPAKVSYREKTETDIVVGRPAHDFF